MQHVQQQHLQRIVKALQNGAEIHKSGMGGWVLAGPGRARTPISSALVAALDDRLERVDDRTTRVGTTLRLRADTR